MSSTCLVGRNLQIDTIGDLIRRGGSLIIGGPGRDREVFSAARDRAVRQGQFEVTERLPQSDGACRSPPWKPTGGSGER